MKMLATFFGLALLLAAGPFAQGNPDQAPGRLDTLGNGKVKDKLDKAMKNPPKDMAEKIKAARDAAKAAKDEVDAMKANGKTRQEVEAMVAEKKAAASKNLQKALDNLDEVSAEVKERVSKSKDVASKRLEERKAEAKSP